MLQHLDYNYSFFIDPRGERRTGDERIINLIRSRRVVGAFIEGTSRNGFTGQMCGCLRGSVPRNIRGTRGRAGYCLMSSAAEKMGPHTFYNTLKKKSSYQVTGGGSELVGGSN